MCEPRDPRLPRDPFARLDLPADGERPALGDSGSFRAPEGGPVDARLRGRGPGRTGEARRLLRRRGLGEGYEEGQERDHPIILPRNPRLRYHVPPGAFQETSHVLDPRPPRVPSSGAPCRDRPAFLRKPPRPGERARAEAPREGCPAEGGEEG